MRTETQRLLNTASRPEIYEEVTVDSARGPIVLSVWKSEPATATVVFLPGTMTHPLFYEEFLDGLAAEGFTVVGVHFTGHGKSPRLRSAYRFEDLASDALAAVAFATERFGEPLLLMGSSQGSAVALSVGDDPRLAALVCHNVFDPARADTIRITRYPRWMGRFNRGFVGLLRLLARAMPRLPVPVGLYLDLGRVCREQWTQRHLFADPIGLQSYPLAFMASLLSADISTAFSGRMRCPLLLVTDRGDPLFPFDYQQDVFRRIVCPEKLMLDFDLGRHLILNEAPQQVLPRLTEALRSLVPG